MAHADTYADKLRKYHLQVDKIVCNSYTCFGMLNECNVSQCASVIYEHDQDFGDVEVIDTVNDADNLLPSQKTDIKYEIGCQLPLITNSKSHTGFRLVSNSMTLNDLERRNSPYFAFFHRIRQIFRPIISQWLKIDL